MLVHLVPIKMDIQHIKKTAIEVLKKQKGHLPQFIFVKGKKSEIILASFKDDEEGGYETVCCHYQTRLLLL